MTVIIDRKLPVTSTQTHALVIGVNDYPYLEGGSGKRASETYGLQQLTSPVPSAERFIDFLKKYDNTRAPLGTVAFLASPAPPSYPGVKSATFDNIQAAFDGWYDRCNQLHGNVAIFYFCGHGMEPHATLLLPQDFGENEGRPWQKAIDFSLTYQRMAELGAQTQCFILDACRDSPSSVQKVGTPLGTQPLRSKIPLSIPPRNAPILMAAGIGLAAHADPKPGTVSYFTSALVDCLTRLGASHQANGAWIVTLGSLKVALKRRIARTIMSGNTKPGGLTCDVGGGKSGSVENLPDVEFHRFVSADVMGEITCRPESAMRSARLTITSTSHLTQSKSMNGSPWDCELPALITVDVSGKLPPGGSLTKVVKATGLLVHPPMFSHIAECTP